VLALEKKTQLVGAFSSLVLSASKNHAIIYPSGSNLLRQGSTSSFKRMLTADTESGCLRREIDSKLPKAGDRREVFAC
jgi:hypothetical protein